MAPKNDPSSLSTDQSVKSKNVKWVPKDLRDYEVPKPGQKYTGFFGKTLEQLPLLKRLNWLHVPLLILTPLIGLYGIFTTPWNAKTYAFAVAYYFFTGLGITAGYHRLFAHRAYKATWLARVILLLAGAGAVEGSARWWSRDHRAHHRFVDTDQDPYSASKGFWYSHIGWMLVKQDKEKIGGKFINIKDLEEDPLVRFQHKFYLPIAIFMGVVFPTIFCGLLWGDYYGGYFIAGVARLVFVHHSTFFVNSLAHWAGTASFSDAHTARNSIITAFVTLGEGYHNFHHEFPNDYRNGVKWWQYDPTKVTIYLMSLVGLTYDLIETSPGEILKGELQMQQKALQEAKKVPEWGPHPDHLPVVSWSQFTQQAKAKKWVVMRDDPLENETKAPETWYVLDVSKMMDPNNWMTQHPGGVALLEGYLGQDITAKFNYHTQANPDGYYKHSNAAHNVAVSLRVAKLSGPPPTESTKTK